MNEDSKQFEITCRMFRVLAERAAKVDDPRINTAEFGARLLERKGYEKLLVVVERYCYEKGLPSLSGLVVLTHNQGGKDVSFPSEEWFGVFIPAILDGKIAEWKHPLSKKQREWYTPPQRKRERVTPYWREVHLCWKAKNAAQEAEIFESWLRAEIQAQKFTEWFPWPTTDAPPGVEETPIFIQYAKGLFSYFGYRVGNNGRPEDDRRETLDWIFHNELPKINSEDYMQKFGEPESSPRLEAMADFLAAQARNFVRKMAHGKGDYRNAIRDYKDDLAYLYGEYYVGWFHFDEKPERGFAWPEFPDVPELPEPETEKPKIPAIEPPPVDEDDDLQEPVVDEVPPEQKPEFESEPELEPEPETPTDPEPEVVPVVADPVTPPEPVVETEPEPEEETASTDKKKVFFGLAAAALVVYLLIR